MSSKFHVFWVFWHFIFDDELRMKILFAITLIFS